MMIDTGWKPRPQRRSSFMKKRTKILLLGALLASGLAAQSTHSVTLTWTDPNNPSGTTYNVYKMAAACPALPPATVAQALTVGFTKLNSAAITTLTSTDTAVSSGGTYCYVITAVSGSTESNPSPQAGATVLPFSPASLTLTAH